MRRSFNQDFATTSNSSSILTSYETQQTTSLRNHQDKAEVDKTHYKKDRAFVDRRWTTEKINFNMNDPAFPNHQWLDCSGKAKYLMPSEAQPLYSSFSNDGVFPTFLCANCGKQRSSASFTRSALTHHLNFIRYRKPTPKVEASYLFDEALGKGPGPRKDLHCGHCESAIASAGIKPSKDDHASDHLRSKQSRKPMSNTVTSVQGKVSQDSNKSKILPAPRPSSAPSQRKGKMAPLLHLELHSGSTTGLGMKPQKLENLLKSKHSLSALSPSRGGSGIPMGEMHIQSEIWLESLLAP